MFDGLISIKSGGMPLSRLIWRARESAVVSLVIAVVMLFVRWLTGLCVESCTVGPNCC